jgi:tRNA(fMet)-specific endonuclease VapC
MIMLDTSILVHGLGRSRRLAPALHQTLEGDERILVPSLVLYEWLRGPRTPEELGMQEALFPSEAAVPFGPREAAVGAKLYSSIGRARSREIDVAIAACAICHDAELWTDNRADFDDLPGLRLARIA